MFIKLWEICAALYKVDPNVPTRLRNFIESVILNKRFPFIKKRSSTSEIMITLYISTNIKESMRFVTKHTQTKIIENFEITSF